MGDRTGLAALHQTAATFDGQRGITVEHERVLRSADELVVLLILPPEDPSAFISPTSRCLQRHAPQRQGLETAELSSDKVCDRDRFKLEHADLTPRTTYNICVALTQPEEFELTIVGGVAAGAFSLYFRRPHSTSTPYSVARASRPIVVPLPNSTQSPCVRPSIYLAQHHRPFGRAGIEHEFGIQFFGCFHLHCDRPQLIQSSQSLNRSCNHHPDTDVQATFLDLNRSPARVSVNCEVHCTVVPTRMVVEEQNPRRM